MAEFYLDGRSHAVSVDDVIIIPGPACFYGNTSKQRFEVGHGERIIMTLSNLAPGEVITITHTNLPPSRFFRPMENSDEVNQDFSIEKTA